MEPTLALRLERDPLQEHEGGELHHLGLLPPGQVDQDGDDQGGKPQEERPERGNRGASASPAPFLPMEEEAEEGVVQRFRGVEDGVVHLVGREPILEFRQVGFRRPL